MKLDFDTKTSRLQIPFRPTTARQTQADQIFDAEQHSFGDRKDARAMLALSILFSSFVSHLIFTCNR
jgi:hypothetical protein